MKERICIKCNTALERKMMESVEIDSCPGCKGLWLDRGEIRQLSSLCAPEAHEPKDDSAASPYRMSQPPVCKTRSPLDAPCPACGGKLSQANFEDFTVEHCTVCEGIYLDAGELDKAMVAVNARGNKAATIVALAKSVATSGSIGS